MHGSGKETGPSVVKAAPIVPSSPCSTDLRVREVVHAIPSSFPAGLGHRRAPDVQPGTGLRHHHLQRHPGGHQGLHHHRRGGHQRGFRHRRLHHRHAHPGPGHGDRAVLGVDPVHDFAECGRQRQYRQ
ncbi:hypothetical protein G6F65_019325 [Rhizopus arrhizus]|nr:hypothetical protein G6F65_019325 [Rhizopus arrhizus]